MKKHKVINVIISIFFICVSIFSRAQEDKIKFENIINQEFGTLLESLLIDGEINEANAKIYLETVFGYDEIVSDYLHTTNLTQQINNYQKGSMSMDIYLTTLSNSLIGLVPKEYQNEIQNNIRVQTIIQGSIEEIASGRFGENSYQLVDGIIKGIQENNQRIAKEKILLEKIKAITPTLTSLNKNTTFFKKEKYLVSLTKENWVERSSPDWSKKINRLNKSEITSNGIQFEGDWKNIDPPTYQFFKYFKNTEKFDFSKDFRAEFEISVENSNTYNYFYIQLAGMYQISLMCYQSGNTKAFTIQTPKEYFLTNKYGVFYNTMYTQIAGYKSTIIRNKSNSCVDYTKPIKVVMEKRGSKLVYRVNDCVEAVEIDMNYFYNKYALDFKFSGKVFLHSMTLEHL